MPRNLLISFSLPSFNLHIFIQSLPITSFFPLHIYIYIHTRIHILTHVHYYILNSITNFNYYPRHLSSFWDFFLDFNPSLTSPQFRDPSFTQRNILVKMIGELVSSCLILVLGYAYPAFQCFKTVEKNRVEIPELRFWCQYWIIVAIITILEKIGDVFISWLPMYDEMKLALFIYLWYPKTKGTGYIYETLLRPYVSRHETDIDRSLIEFRDRAWNLAVYYWHNCTELGSTKILEFLHYVTSQSARSTQSNSENAANQQSNGAHPSAPPSKSFGFFRRSKPDKRRQPSPPSGPSTSYRNQTPKSEAIKVQLQNQPPYIRPEDILIHDSAIGAGLEDKSGVDDDIQAARLRLRRFMDGN
ncbi:HVA22/DP1 protein [Handroanthus impetiginosus]|uniref:HVA22-like protein n=1 Tax=Handroanthus impetiginosus TaxID=429701 RepID=A0A2G9GMR1_9LAMI|nr:HVA22/DP1 protein [Handroanthus impetiginosus]